MYTQPKSADILLLRAERIAQRNLECVEQTNRRLQESLSVILFCAEVSRISAIAGRLALSGRTIRSN